MNENTVNRRLTRKRPKQHRENPEYAAMLTRMIQALGRRVASADYEDLAAIKELRTAIDDATQAAVDGLRTTGYSWTEIGRGLGITKQAAQQRYGR